MMDHSYFLTQLKHASHHNFRVQHVSWVSICSKHQVLKYSCYAWILWYHTTRIFYSRSGVSKAEGVELVL